MMKRCCVTAGMFVVALSASLSPVRAAPASRHDGGYGPIRLGMPAAEAKQALEHIAHDVSFLSMAALANDDEVTLSRMAVVVPWEDSFVGRLDPATRIQFGIHDGRVVTVMLRTSLSTQGHGCRDAFAALVSRNETEFGPLQVADVPANPDAFTDANATFPGWSLALSRLEMEAGTCNLTADYTSDADKDIEAKWRASMR